MSSKKNKKKPVWLRDEIWDDTPDMDEIEKTRKTKAYQQIKPYLDEIHKRNRKNANKNDENMILSQKNKKEINKYFNDFIVNNTYSKIKEKAEKEILEYDKDWNALMELVNIIENKYKIDEIVSKHNYVGFIINDQHNIQDKGSDKKEAFYLVCFKALKKFWKEGKINLEYRNDEPFDYEDLK